MPQTDSYDYEKRYDSSARMVSSTVPAGHYHCSLPVGTAAHHTRESLSYAITLLEAGESEQAQRAADIVAQVLSLQDTDPASRTYGIWPMYLEEPLEVLAVPDWNYADFVGSQLVHVFANHVDALPAELALDVRNAIGHAAWSIFRRNVGPHYTNISLSGAGVTAAVGELLGESRLVHYARRRLENMIAHYDYHRGFNEYNSPGYGMAGIHWCEWVQQFVRDSGVRTSAERLRTLTWKDYANHFHPSTGQLAGPQSRAYTDWLNAQIVAYLRQQTGVTLPWRGSEAELKGYQHNAQPELFRYVRPLPSPPNLVQRFQELPQAPFQQRHTYIRRAAEPSVVGTVWFAKDACLGSINRDNLWVQRRPLLGYWCTTQDAAVCLRVHFFKDGTDFASAYISNVQVNQQVLSAFSLLTHKGDWHDHIDRPDEEGVFSAEDFRVRYALTGHAVKGVALSAGHFELEAAPWRAVIHTAPGHFGPYAVQWQIGHQGSGAAASVFLDGICYTGPRRTFRFSELGDIVIAAAVELLHSDADSSAAPVRTTTKDDNLYITWSTAAGLKLRAPLRAGPHPCSI